MKDLFNLQGKVAIVTGGNGGIGKGIARGLASAGCGIAVAARNSSKTDEAVRQIRKEFGVPVLGVQVDIRQEDQINAMAAKVLEALGRIDILVNNAGMNIRKFPQDLSSLEWNEILETNVRSAFLSSKAVYPAMKNAGRGKIINIASVMAIFGGAKHSPYASSKGAIVQLSKCLAIAWAPDHIQVNSLLPGWVSTELTIQARKDIPGLHESVIARTPAARWGEPEDMAGAAIFLASRASDYVTGAALLVDGGLTIAA